MSPTREQCFQAAADVYGQILSDPERRAQIVAARERRAADREHGNQPTSKPTK